MTYLFQNALTISPKWHPLFRTSNSNLPHSPKRLLFHGDNSNTFSNVPFRSYELLTLTSSALPYKRSTPLELELATSKLLIQEDQEGIEIVKYLQGKNIFVTGVTGFLAKVLIEKLLRTIPDVGKIYVLIKAKDNDAATKRLKNEVINVDVFKCLQQFHGTSYESFMLSKLVPVVGNLREPNLGLDNVLEVTMAEDVDIIINSAGTTNFHERYDVAIDINTIGSKRVMVFAKKCKKLKLFLQISTAYVNGQRQGKIMENPFRMGESINMGNLKHEEALSIDNEIHLALSSAKAYGSQEMKKLGLERARKYGWQDTYVFTKAMGEMLIGSMGGDVPVVILRPSIIKSTYRDPFPGWMEGNRMIDPVLMYYGKGHLLGFPGDPNVVLDVVPVDMVVNATLAAIAKHGEAGNPGINVYHVASSVANPLTYKDLANHFYLHFAKLPCSDSRGSTIQVKPFKIYNSVDNFLSQGRRERAIKSNNNASDEDLLSRKLENINRKLTEQAKNLVSLYEPYVFYVGRFDNKNTHSLIESMSEEEKRAFHFDVEMIDWKDYIINVHIPGVRRHVMKEVGL